MYWCNRRESPGRLGVHVILEVNDELVFVVGDGPVKGSFHAASASSVDDREVMPSRGWF